MRTVAHNTAFLTGASIVQKALSFVYFIILSRAFGVSGIGAFTYALSFTTIFAILVDGGVTPVLIREIAAHPQSARATLARTLKYKGIFLIAAGVIMVTVALQLEAAQTVWGLIAIAAAVMVCDSLNLTLYGVLRAFHTVRQESIGLLIAQLIAIIFGLYAVIFHTHIGVALVGLGVASVTNNCLSIFVVRRRLRQIDSSAPCQLSHSAFLREALPFGFAGAFARGYSYIDALMIGEMVSVAAVGLYGIANKLTFAFQFLPLALSASLYPAFSAELAESTEATPGRLRELWSSAERYLLFTSAGIVAGLIALSEDILGIYGRSFVEAKYVLVLLALSLTTSFISYPIGALLNAARLQKLQTTAMGVTFCVNAVLNFILIPRVGIFGAACAAWVGNVCLAGVGAYFAHTRVVTLPWRSFLRTVAQALCAAVFAGIIMVLMNDVLPWVVAGCLGIIVYAGSLFLLRAISVDEFRALLIRIKKI